MSYDIGQGRCLLKLLFKLLRNNDGYTAVECGILVNLGVIFLEKLLIGF